jgi:hypothetical protein
LEKASGSVAAGEEKKVAETASRMEFTSTELPRPAKNGKSNKNKKSTSQQQK